jgi:DNA-binding NtrC family response regulator
MPRLVDIGEPGGAVSGSSQVDAAAVLSAFELPAILLSPDYRIVAANRAYTDRYGPIDAIGEARCFAVSHAYDSPCDDNGESCPLAACRDSDRPARVVHVHETPRGPEHVAVEMRPVRDAAGVTVQYVEIIRPLDYAGARPDDGAFLGRSRAFNQMVGLLERVAPSPLPVLLLGESGTGKELASRVIHERSPRSAGPFVPLECAGLSASLFESELFGYERGAFTGAQQRKEGLIDAAAGGTLFLDEIGDVPGELQVKLLRLLETGTYRRVGGTEWLRADFRLVCATHRDLRSMVAEGSFRQDLYYRIGAFPVRMPALRDRREDVPLLADAFLARGPRPLRLGEAAAACLMAHDFPGNIRELRNVIDRACLLCDGDEIRPEHLPEEVVDACGRVGSRLAESAATTGAPPSIGREVRPLVEVEAEYLRWAERQFPGDRRTLAARLGVSERTLYRKLRQALE